MAKLIYEDKWSKITTDQLSIKCYYFPLGTSKDIKGTSIKAVYFEEQGGLDQAFKVKGWGMSLSPCWWACDIRRRNRQSDNGISGSFLSKKEKTPSDFSNSLHKGMADAPKSGTGAPSGQGDAPPGGESGAAPTGNQEGADDKDEKKELDGTGAGTTGGEGTTGGATGTTGATGTEAGTTSGKKKKKGKKGKKKKTAHFKKRGHPCYKVLCIVFSLLSLASLATAMTMAALMLNEASK